jgi:hypothetical protein
VFTADEEKEWEEDEKGESMDFLKAKSCKGLGGGDDQSMDTRQIGKSPRTF